MSEVAEHKKPCILIVDDDRLTLAMLAIAIRSAGYHVLQAESAEQALQVIAQQRPDLAVLDISMPGMSGLELAQRLRVETTIPFMFLSSHDEDDMVAQAIDQGAVGYLVKPIASAQLMPAVKAALARASDIKRLQHREAALNLSLGQAQDQLMQTDKMASIGQLAAGVAHEINNPIGYVQSNIGALESNINDLFRILDAYIASEKENQDDAQRRAELERIKTEFDLHFLRDDIPALLGESKEGISRVRKIVQDLKDFSHVDDSRNWQWADLRKGLDSTLNIVNNEIKYKATVVKEYGEIPEIECLPGQLNQVFLNLLVNAAHAVSEPTYVGSGQIVLRTGCDGDQVWVEISDNGCGISPENLKLIFNPFFTTKPIGKGTGLGLSLSYGIVQKHGGNIRVESKEGEGTTFRVTLPQHHSAIK